MGEIAPTLTDDGVEGGSHVIGVAADDFVRVRLDGVQVFADGANDAFTFRDFHMVPVSLNAGSMMALDYADNIVWNTINQIGGTFHLGEKSGYQFDDGFALDLCSAESTCTRAEREICE